VSFRLVAILLREDDYVDLDLEQRNQPMKWITG